MFRRKRVTDAVLESGVAGEIKDHNQEMTHKAVVQMLAGNPYFSFGIKSVAKASGHKLNAKTAKQWMSEALGISLKRFEKNGPSYIDPDLTVERLHDMMGVIDEAILNRRRILMATGHPGSMLQFYLRLEQYIRDHQEEQLMVTLDKSWRVSEFNWIDCVGSVLVVCDVGSLLHTHDHEPMDQVLKYLKGNVDLVIADHGFAGSAVNAGIKTIGLHDVDDPAIPIAERLGQDVLPIPINDNQGNINTHRALDAVISER